MSGRVAEAGEGRSLGPLDGLHALVAGKRTRGEQDERTQALQKERTGSAMDCDYEGIQVGEHVGHLANRASAPAAFDALTSRPHRPVTARAAKFPVMQLAWS